MKDLALLVLVGIVFFFISNNRQTIRETYAVGDTVLTAPVSPEIVQAIIEAFQGKNSDLHPIDTVFVNTQPDGGYKARILFYNTKYFFAVQHDITATLQNDGTMMIKSTEGTASIDVTHGYKPDEYLAWNDVEVSNDVQFKNALSKVMPALQTRA